jgi:hypothetical protein
VIGERVAGVSSLASGGVGSTGGTFAGFRRVAFVTIAGAFAAEPHVVPAVEIWSAALRGARRASGYR